MPSAVPVTNRRAIDVPMSNPWIGLHLPFPGFLKLCATARLVFGNDVPGLKQKFSARAGAPLPITRPRARTIVPTVLRMGFSFVERRLALRSGTEA